MNKENELVLNFVLDKLKNKEIRLKLISRMMSDISSGSSLNIECSKLVNQICEALIEELNYKK